MAGKRHIAIAGASGLVGNAILRNALEDPSIEEVHVLCRQPLTVSHPKLLEHQVDFQLIPPLPEINEVYLAVGTTMHQAGSRAAFRAVDLTINLAVAQAARAAGAQRIGLVSAMAANPKSPFFYNRVKGELEAALTDLSPDGLVIARPSMLLGDREALGQPIRASETLTRYASRVVWPLIPQHYRPIQAQKVARALLHHVPTTDQTIILRSGEMQTA
ncbi:NAD-dependent epimerase/dehydratase family protein [Vibrio rhizosphaerae]|uniref:NAD-dependent epimerase/dehydratase family protein n=1 Tax=Vibrio rhizosphaerae TaxID=398736 RepID=A0ABU4IPL2_9VIBR|nr:NAD-dependent epimerase/dehydratase family protein [Vibrio rhizosphaerae]MDW6091344.1 NAD-dependent epimerase/dehydratase family protein [Vibrio rhizosphaerae]